MSSDENTQQYYNKNNRKCNLYVAESQKKKRGKTVVIVAAHGDVDAYCAEHDMAIGERHEGKLEDYAGGCVVVVTDNCDSLNDFYYLQLKMRRRGVELVSTHWSNDDVAVFVRYLGDREKQERRKKFRGRMRFGYRLVNGEEVEVEAEMAVARRIVELRDAGVKFKDIAADEKVCYPDGRRMSISTIQVILKNREKYE